MSRLVPLLAALLFLAVAASAYKTTITTVEVDGSGWKPWGRRQGKCTQELQEADLRQCEKHIMEKIGGQDEEEDVLRLRGLRRNRRSDVDDDLEQCCEQLRGLKEPRCQCEALLQIMKDQSEELQGREEMQEMVKEVKKLPRKCELPMEEQIRKCVPGMGF